MSEGFVGPAFGRTITRASEWSDQYYERREPPRDLVSAALNEALDGGACPIDGIWRIAPCPSYPHGVRYNFAARYYSKPCPVLVNWFEPIPPETNEYIHDPEAREQSWWAQQIEQSVLEAAAVQRYNRDHPNAKYGYMAIWRLLRQIPDLDAQNAMNGEVITLPQPVWWNPDAPVVAAATTVTSKPQE